MGRLAGRVAVVTGASRGAGRGIALVLGSEGATVYVTARSTRAAPTVRETPRGVEDTAEEVTARGGNGIPVACDHTDDAQVEDLFARVSADHGRLDVLVSNAWGGYMPYAEHQGWFSVPFWQQSMERWDGMFTAGLRRRPNPSSTSAGPSLLSRPTLPWSAIPGRRWQSATWPESTVSPTSTGASRLPIPSTTEFGIQEPNA